MSQFSYKYYLSDENNDADEETDSLRYRGNHEIGQEYGHRYYLSSLSFLEDEKEQQKVEQFIEATKKALFMLGDDDNALNTVQGEGLGTGGGGRGLSENLRRLLLSGSTLHNSKGDEEEGFVTGDDVDVNYGTINTFNNDSISTASSITLNNRKRRRKKVQQIHETDNEGKLIFSGVPRPPFYREVAIRLYLLTKHHRRHWWWWQWRPWKQKQQQQESHLVDATALGMTELKTPSLPSPPPIKKTTKIPSIQHLMAWLHNAGDEGILHLLGMRSTVGTSDDVLLPPDCTELLKAANCPHKKTKNPQQMLTVAARARTKHAHRGQTDLFFGTIIGSPSDQNVVTQNILMDMLHDAVWINIHLFSGQTHPVLEIRVEEGYGARWTIMAKDDEEGDGEGNVVFRGFLEPQMEDGHERKWRH